MALEPLTGALLVIVPLTMLGAFAMLRRAFDYPDILREPTETILTRFWSGGRRLVALWSVFALTAFLFIPIVVLLHESLSSTGAPYLGVATVFGVLAGVTQGVGLLRWPILVPYLASRYADPSASKAARDAVEVVFQASHRYLGTGVGETLGYAFTGLWTLLIAPAMAASPAFHPWIAWFGVLPASMILVGLLEPVGVRWAGAVNAIGYTLWPVWLLVTGAALLV